MRAKMKTFVLPGGKFTTQLGMGSAKLMGTSERGGPNALLESAFDAGIRHFDTAPVYGMGHAEECIGKFLARHKGDVSITTKYGLAPPKYASALKAARNLVKPLILAIPGLKKKAQSVAVSVTKSDFAPSFTVAGARESLERSLRLLQVERIDIWLLHEPTASDLSDDSLLRFMEEAVRAGKIGCFGVGSEARKIPDIYKQSPTYCAVIQCEWDPASVKEEYPGAFRIFHQVIQRWPPRIAEQMRRYPRLGETWSSEVRLDLMAPGVLQDLALRAGLITNPEAGILFASSRKKNIARNAAVAQDTSLDAPALRLLGILRREMALLRKITS